MEYFPKIYEQDIKVGNTPYFLTDNSIIKKRYTDLKKKLDDVWGKKNIIAYSFKTNYEVIRGIKKNKKINAEVVSEMEYKMAKSFGFLDNQIIYNGPFKKDLKQILNSPVLLNIDNFDELKKIVLTKRIKTRIGIRLNSKLKNSRFGFNIENGEAKKAIDLLKNKNIKIKGLHVHLGFFTSPKVYKKISKKIVDFVKNNNLEIEYLDFGGGFPSHGNKPYGYKKLPYCPIEQYILQICEPLNNFYLDKNKPILILETGRLLVDDSTVLISKVIDVKNNKKNQKITLDVTNTMLPAVWFRPQIVEPFREKKSIKIETIIYGSSCQENDILYRGKMSFVKENDVLIFYCVGAYNQSMSAGFIFEKPGYFLKNK